MRCYGYFCFLKTSENKTVMKCLQYDAEGQIPGNTFRPNICFQRSTTELRNLLGASQTSKQAGTSKVLSLLLVSCYRQLLRLISVDWKPEHIKKNNYFYFLRFCLKPLSKFLFIFNQALDNFVSHDNSGKINQKHVSTINIDELNLGWPQLVHSEEKTSQFSKLILVSLSLISQTEQSISEFFMRNE